MTNQKVAVTERALIQRINRKLKPDYEQLKISRSPRMEANVGRCYILDLRGNFVSSQDVDPESFGRKLGVLQPWEEVSTED